MGAFGRRDGTHASFWGVLGAFPGEEGGSPTFARQTNFWTAFAGADSSCACRCYAITTQKVRGFQRTHFLGKH